MSRFHLQALLRHYTKESMKSTYFNSIAPDLGNSRKAVKPLEQDDISRREATQKQRRISV
jgi:hypothetical protein